uniref:Flagellar biosynthesis protein FlhA n=1 Tax=Panagrolaimus superbus TaxID=310955 RepID=A0A914YFG9_9BILA
MRTILETLAEHAPIQSDPHELTAVVRVALGRAITQQWFPGKDEVHVIGLDTPLERLLLQALQGGGGLEPGLADRLLAQTQEALCPSGDAGCAASIVGEPRAATIIVSLPAPQLAAVSGPVESGTV